MSQDHSLRIATACTFFASGCVTLAAAFVPANWPSSDASIAVGCLALALSVLLSRRAFAIAFMGRAPSGPVSQLKGFFACVGALAFLLSVLGLALFFQQEPIGSGARNYPASLLAVFSLHPLVCAYLVLAATGRARGQASRNGA
jgi:hypothetical protein